MPRVSILLRYIVIAAAACLVVVEGRSGGPPWGAVATLVLAAAANAMAGIVPSPVSRGRAFTAAVIVADALWLGVALATTRRFGADFFAVYFFVLLLAAIADGPALAAVAAAVACGGYL